MSRVSGKNGLVQHIWARSKKLGAWRMGLVWLAFCSDIECKAFELISLLTGKGMLQIAVADIV